MQDLEVGIEEKAIVSGENWTVVTLYRLSLPIQHCHYRYNAVLACVRLPSVPCNSRDG